MPQLVPEPAVQILGAAIFMSRHASLLRFSTLALISAGLVFAHPPQPQAAAQSAAPATITIKGDISTPLTLTAEDLAKMPRETVSVEDQDGMKVQYEGVLLREILKRAGAPLGNQLRGKALASYVLAHAHDGYEVVFTLGELDAAFGNQQILVVDKRDGKPLFGYQGPFRLVCPNDKAGARSVRMLETLEVVRLQK
jgi:DMSO/TMAO reductase YedYZ molybdopterin-dependent catalytic subunit